MFLSKFSIKNPVITIMLVIALIAFGAFSLQTLDVELTPSIDAPVVTVTTIYPGADSKTIEEEITKITEDELAVINGIDNLSSTVVDNLSLTVVKFKDGVNTDRAVQDIRDKITFVKRSLPEDAEDPIVEKLDINAVAILSVILKAPAGENPSVVTEFAEKKVKESLASVNGVGKVELYGGREREVKLLMDPLKVDSFDIPPLSLIQARGASSLKIPAGTIKMNNGTKDVNIRGDGEITQIDKLLEMPLIKAKNGSTLKVKDFARVVDGIEEEQSASFMGLTPAIGMDVKKQGKVNVVKLAKEVRAEVDQIRKTLPEGYSLEIIGDTSPFTQTAVQGSVKDVFLGAILAMLVVLLFLMNKKAALIVAVSLPTSIIGTFLFVKTMGFSLNIMTTLALSICVGILTDDAIVVIEAVLRHIRMGKTKIRATIDATKEVGFAVLAAEMTLIAVFGSTVMMEGIVGQFFKEFGMTVIFAILISLTVSFTVIPLFSSIFLKTEKKTFFIFRFMDKFLHKLDNIYAKIVELALKHKIIVIILSLSLLFGGVSLLGKLKSEFMPTIDMGIFTVKMELPSGTSIEQTKKVNREVIEKISDFNWEKSIYSSIGAGATKEKNLITLKVTMTDRDKRKEKVLDAIDQTRYALKEVSERHNAKLSFISQNDSSSMGVPIQLNLLGNSFEDLEKASRILMNFMKNESGFKDVMSDNKGYKKEIIVKFDHDKMTDLGVNTAESAATLRYLISGIKVAKMYNDSGDTDEVKIYVDDPYKNLNYIKSIPLKSSRHPDIKLADVADIRYGSSIVQIQRYNKQRTIKISADIAKGHDMGTLMAKLRNFATDNLPENVSYAESGMAETMSKSFSDLLTALIISIFLIYIVLSGQFNSFIHPFTIMSALPFAMTGAIFTLYTLNIPLSVFGFIGLILLMGIVTKNSILLVDHAIQLKSKGMDVTKALVESARTRLNPILMTALTTILGMVPVVVSTAEGSELKHAMGWAVIGGLIFSTFVTLIIVPVIFSLFDKLTLKVNPEREKEINEL